MAIPERDTVYTTNGTDTTRSVYTRESSSTGWFVGIIVALALLAIGYLVFSANAGSSPSTTVDVNNTPAVTAPVDNSAAPVPADNTMAPAPSPAPSTMQQAPATDSTAAPMTPAPATPANNNTAPANNNAAPATPVAPAAAQ